MPSPEASVVHKLKQHLVAKGVRGPASNIVVDAHATNIRSKYTKQLQPFARVDIEGSFPDIVCQIARDDRAHLTAFEVKPDLSEWLRGMGQAKLYRSGVHESYLALPGKKERLEYRMIEHAEDSGIGLLLLDKGGWTEVVKPRRPSPAPAVLDTTLAILAGARMQALSLNHPLNYLVVLEAVRQRKRSETLNASLARILPALKTENTRRHAIKGAHTLGLITAGERLTREGAATWDLMRGVGFDISAPVSKRSRLVDVDPALAAIARVTLLRQTPVRLICDVLESAPKGTLLFPELAYRASLVSGSLARSIFLLDPSMPLKPKMPGKFFRPTVPFHLKQNMWHAGLVVTKAHPSAGKGSAKFAASEDLWELTPY